MNALDCSFELGTPKKKPLPNAPVRKRVDTGPILRSRSKGIPPFLTPKPTWLAAVWNLLTNRSGDPSAFQSFAPHVFSELEKLQQQVPELPALDEFELGYHKWHVPSDDKNGPCTGGISCLMNFGDEEARSIVNGLNRTNAVLRSGPYKLSVEVPFAAVEARLCSNTTAIILQANEGGNLHTILQSTSSVGYIGSGVAVRLWRTGGDDRMSLPEECSIDLANSMMPDDDSQALLHGFFGGLFIDLPQWRPSPVYRCQNLSIGDAIGIAILQTVEPFKLEVVGFFAGTVSGDPKQYPVQICVKRGEECAFFPLQTRLIRALPRLAVPNPVELEACHHKAVGRLVDPTRGYQPFVDLWNLDALAAATLQDLPLCVHSFFSRAELLQALSPMVASKDSFDKAFQVLIGTGRMETKEAIDAFKKLTSVELSKESGEETLLWTVLYELTSPFLSAERLEQVYAMVFGADGELNDDAIARTQMGCARWCLNQLEGSEGDQCSPQELMLESFGEFFRYDDTTTSTKQAMCAAINSVSTCPLQICSSVKCRMSATQKTTPEDSGNALACSRLAELIANFMLQIGEAEQSFESCPKFKKPKIGHQDPEDPSLEKYFHLPLQFYDLKTEHQGHQKIQFGEYCMANLGIVLRIILSTSGDSQHPFLSQQLEPNMMPPPVHALAYILKVLQEDIKVGDPDVAFRIAMFTLKLIALAGHNSRSEAPVDQSGA